MNRGLRQGWGQFGHPSQKSLQPPVPPTSAPVSLLPASPVPLLLQIPEPGYCQLCIHQPGDCGQVMAPSCFSTSFWEQGQWDLLPWVTGGLNGPISAEACGAPLFTTGARTVITSASSLSWPKPNSKPVHCEASSRSLSPSTSLYSPLSTFFSSSLPKAPGTPSPNSQALADIQLTSLFGFHWTCRPRSLPES